MAAMTFSARPLLNRRLAEFGTTIFAEMSALAVSTGSLNLGQGFPDTDGPEEIREAAVRALRDGRGNQYPPGPGAPELRTAIAAHQQRRYGLSHDPDTEVLVTAGATEAIAAALLALLEPGDEVIALEPYYDSYAACIAMAGGRRVPVTLRPHEGAFRLDLDELRDAVTERTRLLLINTPHNPTGTVLTREELRAIAELAVERDLLVVTDEVYEHLVFDDAEHVPLATFPGMRERTVTIGSAGKTFSFTGWKVGWVTGAPDLVAAVHRHLRSPWQALRRGPGHTIAGELQHLTHRSTTQPRKQRHSALRVDRATQGPQPVLAPSLNHDPDGNAPPRSYDTGTHRFPSARLRASAGAPGAWEDRRCCPVSGAACGRSCPRSAEPSGRGRRGRRGSPVPGPPAA
ncbi:aminotransferase class I/II-fold pyridoxal phosphate-dependent enzyme [Streptomyces sp. SID2888]|uniref:aminotransferase class I/II-fold pyridoxal phosphate-dependent enzyme n=1 Tax=Streptomyces sp. SID2888 TaxID=2690256 RepID=UPI001F000E3D|nr:aminotransferase class I/II-fold pyridoxal phosphate-dependent enzyme [Streptomyces sp. SID2888]